MTEWLNRRDHASMPFQAWEPFPPDAIVQIKNVYGQSSIGPATAFWWGYEQEMGEIGDGVIIQARRLDRPRHGDRTGVWAGPPRGH